ncbi:hypothetical protein [Marisediminicola sp. LYQ134]|uniref:hypothetical protein n=1 Tax=Marisediminicola sp. LYQ134 TaxID=3391061 RepID=UPI0039831247
MHIEEHTYPPEDNELIENPEYRIEFWRLTQDGDVEVEMVSVFDAKDYREVDEWARARLPHQYAIYCKIQSSRGEPSATPTRTMFARVGGYDPSGSGAPVEELVSNPEEADQIKTELGEWPRSIQNRSL